MLQAGSDERACISLHKLPGPNRAIKLQFFEKGVPRSISSTLSDSDFLLFETSANSPNDVGGRWRQLVQQHAFFLPLDYEMPIVSLNVLFIAATRTPVT